MKYLMLGIGLALFQKFFKKDNRKLNLFFCTVAQYPFFAPSSIGILSLLQKE